MIRIFLFDSYQCNDRKITNTCLNTMITINVYKQFNYKTVCMVLYKNVINMCNTNVGSKTYYIYTCNKIRHTEKLTYQIVSYSYWITPIQVMHSQTIYKMIKTTNITMEYVTSAMQINTLN